MRLAESASKRPTLTKKHGTPEQLGGSASLAAALPQWISNVPGGSVFCGPMAAVAGAQRLLIKRALVPCCGRMFPAEDAETRR